MTTSTIRPFPFYAMAKPAGARCNLRCAYCYYLEKAAPGSGGRPEEMDDAMLELFVRQYIEAQPTPQVLFTWHGGEPLLRPLAFYRRALELQRRYGRGRHIDNCVQTNGTLITDEWCRFFRDEGFLVGISIDGPRPQHDQMRCGSFDSVMRGIGLLTRHGVQWNAMATVNSLNAGSPAEFYRFFKSIGCRYLQFDDTSWGEFCSQEKRSAYAARGIDVDTIGRKYVACINEILEAYGYDYQTVYECLDYEETAKVSRENFYAFSEYIRTGNMPRHENEDLQREFENGLQALKERGGDNFKINFACHSGEVRNGQALYVLSCASSRPKTIEFIPTKKLTEIQSRAYKRFTSQHGLGDQLDILDSKTDFYALPAGLINALIRDSQKAREMSSPAEQKKSKHGHTR